MKFGILGKSAVAAQVNLGGELSIEELVEAEASFDEAAELASEAESEYQAMDQAIAVGDRVEAQAELSSELMDHPEMVNTGTVALARESMDLALVALGAGGTTEYHVSVEAMESSPLSALEVTQEGVKDVAKKIYEGIKMFFAKIALTIKKMTAKLVVALNGTGKKAEKMLKAFKLDKTAKASKETFDEKESEAMLKTTGGLDTLLADTAISANDVKGVVAMFGTNLRAGTDKAIAELDGIKIVNDAIAADNNDGKLSKTLLETLKNKISDDMYSVLANGLTSTSAASSAVVARKLKGFEVQAIDAEVIEQFNLSGEVSDSTVQFVPTYVKGNKIHGVAYYTEVNDDVGAAKYANVSYQAVSDEDLSGKKTPVMNSADIETKLALLKQASKELSSFSDTRMKDIDKITKAIADLAKVKPGWSMFNRFSGREANKARMFVAGNHVASVFALASMYKAQLSVVAKHVSVYE